MVWEDILINAELYAGRESCCSWATSFTTVSQIKDETIFKDGTLHLDLAKSDSEDNIMILSEGNFRIKPETIHRFTAPQTKVTLIEASTPHLDDVVRLSDDYGRADAKYFIVAIPAKTSGTSGTPCPRQ